MNADKTDLDVFSVCVNALLLIVFIMVTIGLILYAEDEIVQQKTLTMSKCCRNQSCSDTYYSTDDNMCHLVMCERLPIPGMNCTYASALTSS
jgi:hypothetical protein